MKTTIDLPDELLIAAKKRAAETRTSLRRVFEQALRRELAKPPRQRADERPPIPWVTVPGGVPPGVDLSDREAMHEWLRRGR